MSRYTRKAIIASFMKFLNEKSIDKITVKDIIEDIEINRNTFYYHFADIYDLLDAVFEEEFKQFKEQMKGESIYEDYSMAAAFFCDHRRAVENIYHSRNSRVIENYLNIAVDSVVTYYVRKSARNTELSEEGFTYVTSFYRYALMGVTRDWLEHGMQEYHETLLKTIASTFDSTVDTVIAEYIRLHPNE